MWEPGNNAQLAEGFQPAGNPVVLHQGVPVAGDQFRDADVVIVHL